MRIHNGHILGLAAIIIPAAAVFMPLATAPLSYFFAVLLALFGGRALMRGAADIPALKIFLLFLLWAAISLIWSVDPAHGGEKYIRLLAAIILGSIAVVAAAGLTPEQKSLYGKLLLPGFCLCGLLLVIGLLREDGALMPLIDPHNGVPGRELSRMNRGTTILVLCLWPALLLAWKNPKLCALVLFAVAIPAALSASLAALVGLIAGAVMFAAAWFRPRAAITGLLICMIGYIATAPLIHTTALSPAELGVNAETRKSKHSWMPGSAYHRLLIWEFTANHVSEHPITGWGFYSSRVMPSGGVKIDGQGASLPLHPHNGILQVWLELGAIGALIAAALCAALASAIKRLRNREEMAMGAALFACGFIIICVSYGFWQSWWLAALFTVSAFFVAARQSDAPGQNSD